MAIAANTTVTWQSVAATEFMRSSTGSGLSGQDSAIWVRPAGSSSWYLLGVSERFGSGRAGVVRVESYDFQARWFGVYEVKSAVSIAANTTVTWQSVAATEFMRSSTGSGLSGQDSAIWVRPAGRRRGIFSGYPNGSGQVVQELLPSSYDFQARWFGVYEVKSAVAIAANTTVTWQSVAATEFMRSSTGSGLSGQDSAIWVRPAGTSSWYFSGYPNGSGQVVQELLASSYDFQARWFGVYEVKSAVAISANTTVTWQSVAATEFMRSSTGSGLSGQDSAIWVRPAGTSSWYFSGYPNGSGQVVQELFAVELRLPGPLVRCVRGEVGGRDLGEHDRDVAGRGGHAQPVVVDRFGVDGSGQCDLGAAGRHVVVVLLRVSERLGSSRAGAARRQLRRAVPLARRVPGVVGERRRTARRRSR